MTRVIQERLQRLVDDKLLPELWCISRKGRSCIDMVFTVKQMFRRPGRTRRNYSIRAGGEQASESQVTLQVHVVYDGK